MTVRRCALGALACFLLATLPASLAAQTTYRVEEVQPGSGEVEPHSDGYRHRSSGYIYPRALDVVPARKTTTYGPGDADVQYTLYGGGNGDGWINLYVYPANISLPEEVDNVTHSLVKSLNAQLTSAPPEMATPPAGVAEGWYEGTYQGVELKTGFRVARVGNWFIKARISIPANADQAAIDRIAEAVKAINFAPADLGAAPPPSRREPVS